MGDKLTAAIMACAKAQKKVLDRIFKSIGQTDRPSSPGLACCLPDSVIAAMEDVECKESSLFVLSTVAPASGKEDGSGKGSGRGA